MSCKSKVLLILFSVISIFDTCRAAAKGVDLNQRLEVKEKSLQEDLEQFYEDQAHLLPHRNNETVLRPVPGFGQILAQVWNPNEWASMIAQLGSQVPYPTNLIIGFPLDWISQFFDTGRLSNVTLTPSVPNNNAR